MADELRYWWHLLLCRLGIRKRRSLYDRLLPYFPTDDEVAEKVERWNASQGRARSARWN